MKKWQWFEKFPAFRFYWAFVTVFCNKKVFLLIELQVYVIFIEMPTQSWILMKLLYLSHNVLRKNIDFNLILAKIWELYFSSLFAMIDIHLTSATFCGKAWSSNLLYIIKSSTLYIHSVNELILSLLYCSGHQSECYNYRIKEPNECKF